MNYEKEINKLTVRLDNLQKSFEQAQRNQVPVTAKTDDTAIKVDDITPVTMTKTAYIDDTECIFTDVPTGNVSVYIGVPHTVERDGDRVTVRFEPLEEVQTVTINVI